MQLLVSQQPNSTQRVPVELRIIQGLGGGGLATPQVSNISTAIRYAMLAVGMNLHFRTLTEIFQH